MNKKISLGVFGVTAVVLMLALSGCETSTSSGNTAAKLEGTWQGSLQVQSMGRVNTTLTQISFTGNTAVMTLSSDMGTRTMNCSYTVTSDSLVLQPQFGRGFGRYGNGSTLGNWSRPPGNWSRPPGNWSGPGNMTRPDWNNSNWSRPQNGTWPGNGTRGPGNQQRSWTFVYRFEDTRLYLDSVVFTKVS